MVELLLLGNNGTICLCLLFLVQFVLLYLDRYLVSTLIRVGLNVTSSKRQSLQDETIIEAGRVISVGEVVVVGRIHSRDLVRRELIVTRYCDSWKVSRSPVH